MGQSTSAAIRQLEQFTKLELKQLFYARCILLFQPLDIQCLTKKLEIERYSPDTRISKKQLTSLFQFDDEIDPNSNLSVMVDDIYDMFKVLGNFPFCENLEAELTAEQLMVAISLLSCRYKKICQDLSYLKMIFIGLAVDIPSEKEGTYKVEMLLPTEPEDTIEAKCLKINWNSFLMSQFGEVNIDELSIPAEKVARFLTFSIIIDNVRINSDNNEHLNELLLQWDQIEHYSNNMLRYIDVNIEPNNLAKYPIKYTQFDGLTLFTDMFTNNFKYLLNSRLLNFRTPGKIETRTEQSFHESKLIDKAALSYLCSIINNSSSQQISRQNMVKLFAGSESGFSIRSIEQKIFKWRAPTIFIVSGKRLKSKTILSNKRYLEFDSQYPRFFKSGESSLKNWQHTNDTITYAVLVCEPWKNSNKLNFGDENSILYSLGPRFDIHKSVHSPTLQGKLISFNNLGLGLGFGNDQPINKHGVKKYLPGDVSLTIEANLEFAFFRHLVTPLANTNSYFQKSNQQQLKSEDFEDRFIITDVEVWGIGSMKELDDQRRQWEWENKQAENRQNVNLRNLGEERAFLEMVGLVGNHGSGGSV